MNPIKTFFQAIFVIIIAIVFISVASVFIGIELVVKLCKKVVDRLLEGEVEIKRNHCCGSCHRD